VAVDKRILFGSLGAAVIISIGGGWLVSRSGSAGPQEVTITSAGTYPQTGIPTNAVVTGKTLPTVALTDFNGKSVSTASLLGKPLVINVWNTSCEPCQRELPAFAKVHSSLGDAVEFVGVNAGETASASTVEAFAKKYGVNYEDLTDPNGELIVKLGISGFPYTLFVAANGTIVAQRGTEMTEADIRAAISTKLLG
jgi:thiol-disulfide isomerase/thioredoxin